jgi:hypothetical protein
MHNEHYRNKKVQPLDVIENWELDFHLGNCIKYIYRRGIKDGDTILEDLEKAKYYLDRKIELLKKEVEYERFDITQTTASQTITLPAPTLATGVKISNEYKEYIDKVFSDVNPS